MKKILFCNIAWMKYYKGVNEDDIPINGGEWVKKNKYAHEAYNFRSIKFEGEDIEYCLGFVETKSTNGKDGNQLHIEKIVNVRELENTESIEDVIVVWCAKSDCVDYTSVVGWYNNATVYRSYQVAHDEEEEQYYNIIAKVENCVLLPSNVRHRRTLWYVPRTGKKNSPSYGFGQANVWFPNKFSDNSNSNTYLKKIINQINNYDGENLI